MSDPSTNDTNNGQEPTVDFGRVLVKHSPEQEIGPVTVHSAVYVVAGEYAEETPDLVIRVEHAVDWDGNDISERVARFIAGQLQDWDGAAS